MTRQQKIDCLARLIDDEREDPAILELYLDLAAGKVLNRMYPYLTDYEDVDVPDRYAGIQLNVAAYLLNKRGAEGEVQHIENGVHRNYGNSDVPDDMLKDIIPMAAVIR